MAPRYKQAHHKVQDQAIACPVNRRGNADVIELLHGGKQVILSGLRWLNGAT
jgi:hypothetical protein